MKLENINDLLNKKTESEIIEGLQEIGKDILENYIIKMNDDEYLIPLWIEAYACIGNIYVDKDADAFKHPKRTTQYYSENGLHFSFIDITKERRNYIRSRVDIVPDHDKSFAISYLLKLAIYVGKDKTDFKIQSEIAKLLHGDLLDSKIEKVKLVRSSPRKGAVIFQPRVNVSGNFKDEDLTIYRKIGNYTDYAAIRNNRNKANNKERWIQELK